MAAQNKKKKSDVQIVIVKPADAQLPTAELVADKEHLEERLFEELTERADAVDRVLMAKGDPEYDLSSG